MLSLQDRRYVALDAPDLPHLLVLEPKALLGISVETLYRPAHRLGLEYLLGLPEPHVRHVERRSLAVAGIEPLVLV